jgi:hemerythrin-like metal-binding protein
VESNQIVVDWDTLIAQSCRNAALSCSLIWNAKSDNMNFEYFLGIPEIDAQHDEIFAQLDTLLAALSAKEQRHLVGPMLRQLKEMLLAHFANEESFMDTIACADQSAHKTKHKEMLKLLDNCIESLSSPGKAEGLGKKIDENLHAHIAEFDFKMSEAVEHLCDTLRTHEVSDKSR